MPARRSAIHHRFVSLIVLVKMGKIQDLKPSEVSPCRPQYESLSYSIEGIVTGMCRVGPISPRLPRPTGSGKSRSLPDPLLVCYQSFPKWRDADQVERRQASSSQHTSDYLVPVGHGVSESGCQLSAGEGIASRPQSCVTPTGAKRTSGVSKC